jgi:polyisoprenoid-binding protein YceI
LAKKQDVHMSEATGLKMSATDTVLRYRINVGKSRFTVRAFATGLFSSLGHNPTLAIREYAGQATFSPESLQQAALRITVQSASLEVTDDISQKDRTEMENKMRQEVLETSAYPEIIFESSKISLNQLGKNSYSANIAGDLTLHGVSRNETIYAQVALAGDILRAFGEVSLRQTDYGITLVSVAGGTLKVKDEVKVTFDLTAQKQEG